MKFQFIKEVGAPVPSYGGNVVSTGDVVELDGHLVQKAKANPDYRLCDEPIHVEHTEERPAGAPDDLDDLRAQWEAKFGSKPHHKKSAKTLRDELSDGD